MKLVKQLFGIKKRDWITCIKSAKGEHSHIHMSMYLTKKQALQGVKNWSQAGDKIQIYKLSYELKEAFVVGEKVKRGKK